MLRQAYKDSCVKTGVQFNQNENYTGKGDGYIYDQIWADYENCALRAHELTALINAGVIDEDYLSNGDYDDGELYLTTEDAADLIMRFIALSMPDDFTYTVLKDDAEPINGWWNDELNVQFGYGLYE